MNREQEFVELAEVLRLRDPLPLREIGAFAYRAADAGTGTTTSLSARPGRG